MNDSKKQDIIESAIRLFNEYGFHGTSTAKIGKDAGVSNGAIFNRFATKDELIIESYKHVKGHLKDYLDKHFDETLDLYIVFKQLWISSIRWGVENPEYLKYREQINNSPYKNMLNHRDEDSGIEVVCKKKQLFQKVSEISKEDMELLTISMVGATNALALHFLNGDLSGLDEKAGRLYEMLFQGIIDRSGKID